MKIQGWDKINLCAAIPFEKKNSSADMIMSTGDWLIITQEVEILTVDHNVSVHVCNSMPLVRRGLTIFVVKCT